MREGKAVVVRGKRRLGAEENRAEEEEGSLLLGVVKAVGVRRRRERDIATLKYEYEREKERELGEEDLREK